MTTDEQNTSDTAKMRALSDPLRQQILGVLLQEQTRSGISPREISQTLHVPLSTVSYQVRVLAACDVITLIGTKRVRGATQHFYSLSPTFMGLPWVSAVLEAIIPNLRKEEPG